MQPIKQLRDTLENLANEKHYIFSLHDLRNIVSGQRAGAFKSLITRAEKNGLLKRICRGLYLVPKIQYPKGLVLFHSAARLRAHEFNYISLETVLSDCGIISQVMMNWITVMSSGRSYIMDCGAFGHIEFIHTKKSPDRVSTQLSYDARCCLWRASVDLALEDMAQTGRNTDLVDLEAKIESI